MKHLKRVVVGVDFSKPSDNALREAGRIAEWDGAGLSALHVLDSELVEAVGERAPIAQDALAARAERELEDKLEEVLGEGHRAEAGFVIGHPVREVLNSVNDGAADLLVLGAHGQGHSDSHQVGTLASKCVRKASANVLLVRARQEGPFRKVVACVDFSENSRKAIRQAIQVAMQDKAKLEFIHVYQPIERCSTAGHPYLREDLPPVEGGYDTQTAQHLETSLERMARELTDEAGGYDYDVHVSERFDVRNAVVDFLNQTGADLVVLGARGKSSLRSFFLGTTAEKIIHHATCSTLAVKPDGFDYEHAEARTNVAEGWAIDAERKTD